MEIIKRYETLKINAPELRTNPAFVEWLNLASGGKGNGPCAATWHRAPNGPIPIGEYSDLFVWKDKGREGSDSDMPEECWNQLCNLAGDNFVGLLWIIFY